MDAIKNQRNGCDGYCYAPQDVPYLLNLLAAKDKEIAEARAAMVRMAV